MTTLNISVPFPEDFNKQQKKQEKSPADDTD
jgi:hypothetical protein